MDDQNNNQGDQAQVADSESDSSTTSESTTESAQATDGDTVQVAEDGTYTSPEEVAAYIDRYDTLPENYITKSEAEDLGWESSDGNLWEVAEGMSIGGDYFETMKAYCQKKTTTEKQTLIMTAASAALNALSIQMTAIFTTPTTTMNPSNNSINLKE